MPKGGWLAHALPFFSGRRFLVVGARESDDDTKPDVKVNCDEALVIAIRLATGGYYQSPEAALASPVDVALACWDHLLFTAEYQETYREINKNSP